MKAQQYQQFGYVRVSTKEQNLDRQIFALREFGIPDAQIYQEKQSVRDFERPVYRRLIKKLKPGDTLVILGDIERGLAIPPKEQFDGWISAVFDGDRR